MIRNSSIRRSNLASTSAAQVFSGDHQDTFSKRGAPMTVIATMRENEESILIAADGGRVEIFNPGKMPLRSKVNNKLQKHDTAPLAGEQQAV